MIAPLVGLHTFPLAGQSAPKRVMRPATGILSAEFTRIVSVRELSDGRLLIADSREAQLFVGDFGSRAVTPLGRQGGGPGEYRLVSNLFDLGADSTMMQDPFAGRWLILHRDRIVQTIPPDHPAVIAVRRTALRGSDASGFLIASSSPQPAAGRTTYGKSDSVWLVRVARQTARTDTIARLRMPPLVLVGDADNTGELTRLQVMNPPLSVGEEAVLFADGWVAIARLEPFRVDWRAPDGRWTRGAPLPFVEVRMDSREREAYVNRQAQAAGRTSRPPSNEGWPDVLPPFQPRPLLTTPSGELLILRTPSAAHPQNRYDMVDRRGRLVAWLELSESQRIAAVGRHAAYVIVTDDDGIQRLQRHPWP